MWAVCFQFDIRLKLVPLCIRTYLDFVTCITHLDIRAEMLRQAWHAFCSSFSRGRFHTQHQHANFGAFAWWAPAFHFLVLEPNCLDSPSLQCGFQLQHAVFARSAEL